MTFTIFMPRVRSKNQAEDISLILRMNGEFVSRTSVYIQNTLKSSWSNTLKLSPVTRATIFKKRVARERITGTVRRVAQINTTFLLLPV